mgnify:CR=1 FL=1
MAECSHNCSSCSSNCSERTEPQDLREKPHKGSNIKKVIAIASGKGGVGKSFVTSMLAVLMNKKGYKTAVLDADITGPSIPRAFGVTERAQGNEEGLYPVKTKKNKEQVMLFLNRSCPPWVWDRSASADRSVRWTTSTAS